MVTSADIRNTRLVYEPLRHARKLQDALAPHPATLDGKVVALINNTKDLVDSLLDEVKTLITKYFPSA